MDKISPTSRSKACLELYLPYLRTGGVAFIAEKREAEMLSRTTPQELNPRNTSFPWEVCQQDLRKQSVVRDSAASRSQPIGFDVKLHRRRPRRSWSRKLHSYLDALSKSASYLDLRPPSVYLSPTPNFSSTSDLCNIPVGADEEESY